MDSKKSNRQKRKASELKKKTRKSYQRKYEKVDIKENSETLLHSLFHDQKPTICRVCLNEGIIPIYGDESIGDISEALKMYGGIEIQTDDDFPKYLCHACHEQLQSAIKFRQTAQETDQFLRDGSIPAGKLETLVCDEQETEEHLDIEDETEIFKETLADINTIYHCRACKLDFDKSSKYGSHMFLENHENLKDSCPFCSRDFTCIQKHLALHKHHKTILCDICGQKFLQPSFCRHRESHYDVLPFKCSKCPYRSRYAADFKIHMRKHTGERPYRCSLCPAGFINKSNLNRHMLVHKSDFDFQCTDCNKGFWNQRELDIHIKVNHFGVKDHLCNLCGKAFGYRKSLMKHQLQVHKREKLRSGKLPVYLRIKSEKDEGGKKE